MCSFRFWRLYGLRLCFRRLIRCNSLNNFLSGSLCQLRVFQLLTYSHTFSCPHKFGQIHIEGMMGKSCQLNPAVNAILTARESNAEYFRGLCRVFAENLIEIPDTEQ